MISTIIISQRLNERLPMLSDMLPMEKPPVAAHENSSPDPVESSSAERSNMRKRMLLLAALLE
uniref:Uncharacterized protein n=1 Tax=Brassica oleracea var. oleracea TaxID=109376 RepID=A0A0D3B0L3_BRAOL